MPDLERRADRLLRARGSRALASWGHRYSQVFTPFVALAGAPGLHAPGAAPKVLVPVKNKLGKCWSCKQPSSGLRCRACFTSAGHQAKRRRIDAHRARYGYGLEYALMVLDGSVPDFAPDLIDQISAREEQIGPAARWPRGETTVVTH